MREVKTEADHVNGFSVPIALPNLKAEPADLIKASVGDRQTNFAFIMYTLARATVLPTPLEDLESLDTDSYVPTIPQVHRPLCFFVLC